MKRKAPYYVDLDQFLLFFTVHPYAYYAVEERDCLGEDSTINKKSKGKVMNNERKRNSPLSRVKSTQELNTNQLTTRKKDQVSRSSAFNEYMLSQNNPNSIRNRKLR